jgi:hypothetical protein
MTLVSQPPVLGVFVERGHLRPQKRLGALWRLPNPALDIGEDMAKLSLGLGQGDRAERDVLASAGCGERSPR